MIVDCAVYGEGHRLDRPREVAGVRAEAAAARGFAWVGLVEPTVQEFDAVRREFDLHELAVEDAVSAHQRPKLEIYGDTLFLVIKTVRYLGPEELVDIGEVMVFVGPDFLITVRHGEAGGLGEVREHLERQPELLALGPGAALHAIVDRIVDAYEPVVDGVLEDIEEVEAEVFSPEGANPVERIYRLRREVLEFARAALPAPPGAPRADAAGVPNIDPTAHPVLPRRRRPRRPRRRPDRGLRRAPRRRAAGEPDPGDRAPERGHAEDLRLGRDHRRADRGRRDLRDELRAHARARVALRLSGRAAADPRVCVGLYVRFRRVGWL